MKYKMIYILLFIISVFSIGIVNAQDFPLLGKVIYLDPGHGR